MAKIVSSVPKLLTSTIGALGADPPKPVIVEMPAPAVPASNADAKADDSIFGPDLSADLATITERGRGRTGTITTSFRGVLNDSSGNMARRTLLGE